MSPDVDNSLVADDDAATGVIMRIEKSRASALRRLTLGLWFCGTGCSADGVGPSSDAAVVSKHCLGDVPQRVLSDGSLQEDAPCAFRCAAGTCVDPPLFGLQLHSDGDRLFPITATDMPVSAQQAHDTIESEVDTMASAGVGTLKMGLGTDVLHYPSTKGSPRDWRLLPSVWALDTATWMSSSYVSMYAQAQTAHALFSAGMDPVRIALSRARSHGMRTYISYRIADGHFVGSWKNYPLTAQFYLENDVKIASRGLSPVPGYPNYANAMNLGLDAVRAYRLAILQEATTRYADVIDAVEIDFTRSLALFPLGDPGSVASVNRFLDELRAWLDALNADRAMPILLSIRVSGDRDVTRSQGLDVARQIENRVVDIVVPSNIMSVTHDQDISAWAQLANAHKVLIHAGIPSRKTIAWTFPIAAGSSYGKTPDENAQDELILGSALVYRAMGATGIELYNQPSLVASKSGTARLKGLVGLLSENADLRTKPRIFAVTPNYENFYEGRLEHTKSLPATFQTDGSVMANSVDGTPVKQANNQLTCKLFVSGWPGTGTWRMRLALDNPLLTMPAQWSQIGIRILLNGTTVLYDGPLGSVGTLDAVSPVVVPPDKPPALPYPDHYLTLSVPANAAFVNNEFNTLEIRRTASSNAFSIREIQLAHIP